MFLRMWSKENPCVQPPWKTVLSFLKKVKLQLLYNPAITLLRIYMKKPKILIRKNVCAPMFTVHSVSPWFTIAKMWKQPQCLPIDKWIKTWWHIYTIEYHSTIQKNKILPFAIIWMDSDRRYHAKWNKLEKHKHHVISPICRI